MTARRDLDGPARHVTVAPSRLEQAVRWIVEPAGDFLADLVAEIRAEPESHALVAGLGFIAGLFVTVGLAWVWSWFL